MILLAIKAASNGHTMEIEYECPKCQQQSGIDIDLRDYLATAVKEMPDNSVTILDDMIVFLRPYNLHNATQMSLGVYHEARAIQAAETRGEGDVQSAKSLKAMTELDILMTADCVMQIRVPDGVINDKPQIMDFITKLGPQPLKALSERLTMMNTAGLDKDTPVRCFHCHHEWTTQAEFDPASFFRRKLLSLTSQEEVEELLMQMSVDQRELRDDIASIQWHMRGGYSLGEAWSLCWDQRLDVKKLIKERVAIIKETGLALL